MKAYLSGAIEYSQDGGKGWREEMARWLKEYLGHDVFNPIEEQKKILSLEESQNFRRWKNTDYSRFKESIRKLIDADLSTLLDEVDYVICFWDQGVTRGGGTHGEVTLAYYGKKPVYTVLDVPRSTVSSWILGCSSREFDNFEELKSFLEEQYGG